MLGCVESWSIVPSSDLQTRSWGAPRRLLACGLRRELHGQWEMQLVQRRVADNDVGEAEQSSSSAVWEPAVLG
jgi:hypothetical protein